MDHDLLHRLSRTVLGPEHKSIPATAWGITVEDFLAGEPALSTLATPLVTIDAANLAHNTTAMAEWAAARSMLLAPHGKTTMPPQLWQRQLDAGAWAITVATPWQAQVAHRFGVKRIMLANTLIDPVSVGWLVEQLHADSGFEFYCWADSVSSVEVLARILADAGECARPVNVLVEFGAAGGRCGARTFDEAIAVGQAISRSPQLALAGVAGYEGALGHDRSAAAVERIENYLNDLGRLHTLLAASMTPESLITAGGSAYPDLVAAALDPHRSDTVRIVLRSGAYITHDDGFYSGISPFSDAVDPNNPVHLRSAIHGWARVTSKPEAELALLDAGKRDLPYDEGLPVLQCVRNDHPSAIAATGPVSAMNDQHTFVSGEPARVLRIGDVVRLGLSHPCTTFDKWRLIPVVEDRLHAAPTVVDLVHTFF
jgi:D-serine deaminase-like pyridoxal phosphate-dependent protein